MKIGIVGLGRMGHALGQALVGTGATVHGFDTDAGAVARAGEEGVVAAGTLGELATEVDVVITSLPTVAVVRQTCQALADLLRPDSLVLETSTCGPALATELATYLNRVGIQFVDCPVSRKAPEMTMLVGGEEGVLGPAAEALGAVAREIVYCGKLGGGYQTKLLQQYLKYSRFLAASEALVYARRVGLDVAAVIRGLESSTGADAGLASAEELFDRDAVAASRHAPTSTIAKDVELTSRMLTAAGFESPTFAALQAFFLAAAATEFVDAPYPEAARLLETYRFTHERRA